MDVRALGIALPLVALCLLCSRAGAQDGDDFAASALGMEGLGSSPVDLVLLLDTSTFDNTTHSRQQEADVKSFFIRFLADADIDSGNVRVAMVTYSTHPEVLFTLNTYTRTTDVQQAIEAAEFAAGERNTADAISRIRQYVLTPTGGDRPNIPNVILLLQTGQSDRNAFRTAQEAEALRYTGTNIFGIGHQLDGAAQAELEDIVSRPVGENTFLIHQMAELHIVKDIVFLQIFTRADQSYNSPAAASESLDVVFVVHFSSIMKQSEFSDVIRFMKRVVDSAALDNGDVRVAVVLFRKRGVLLYDWNRFFSKHDVIQGLDGIPFSFRSKVASITAGLDTARNELFIDAAGDRRDVPNLVVLVTDSNADADMMQTIPEAERIKATGAAVFTVGVNVTYVDELMGIASSPDYFLLVNSTKYLDGAAYLLYDKFVALRTDEVTEPFPSEQTPPAPPAIFTTMSTTLDVKPARRISTVENREEADIAIAFHISHNVKIRDIKSQFLPFLNDVVASADIDSGAVRISVVSYGTDITTHFDLNTHNKKKKLLKVLRKLKAKPLRAKAGNTLRALQYIANSTFSDVNGDRPGIPNGVILITDKQSGNDLDELTEAAQTIKDAGTPIFVIGVGKADSREVIGIASSPAEQYSYLGKTYTSIAESDELKTMISERFLIFKKLKPKTTTTPTPVASPFTSAVTSTAPTRYLAPISDSEEADIVIALHVSPRATKSDFDSVLDFLRTLVSGADIDNGKVQVGLVFYAADAELIFHMNQYDSVDKMLKEISGMSSDRRSSMVDASAAMALGRQMLSSYFNRRVAVPAALLFITDRSSNQNSNLLASEREGATNEGIEMFSIGIDLDDKQELELLATAPENVMTVSTHTALSGTIDELKRKIFAFRTRSMNDITDITDTSDPQTPAGPMVTLGPPTQEEPIVISLTPQTDLFVSAAQAPPSKGLNKSFSHYCGRTALDLVFILDSSTSVKAANFQTILQATINFLDITDIDTGLFRVGLLVYSSDASVQFNLNTHSTKADVINAIGAAKYTYGRTNTAGALHTMRTEMFTPANGDRQGVSNIAIVVTDGVSNINRSQILLETHLARQKGIRIFAIGVGLTNTSELPEIAGSPEDAFNIEHFEDLEAKLDSLYILICPESPAVAQECALGTVDLVIILDASTSVFEHNFKKVLSFVKDLLKDASFGPGGVRVGVAIFSTNVQIQFHLDRYSTKADVFRAIDDIPFIYGSTNTADSIIAMRTQMFTTANGDRAGVPNVCIIVTDGVSTVNAHLTIPEAELARAHGIHIYAIGVGLSDRMELDAIASKPASANSFTVQNFDELRGLDRKIFHTICPETTPAPSTTTEAMATTTLPATIPPTVPQSTCGLSKVDVIIILDASTSVTQANFKKMLAFCKDLVDKADVDSGSVRFGALIYSTEVEIQFHLNAYSTSADIKSAIDRIPYIYGSTNSADGLAAMHYQMFTAATGDRAGVDNIAFMITDGVSNINARRTIPEAEDARDAGIHIYAIGIGLSDTRELDAMASLPTVDNSFNVKEFDELAGLAEGIFSSGGRGQCATTTTPLPQTTPAHCGLADVDIVIILDASTSVTVANFKKMLAFVKDLLKDAPIDSGSARVATIIYSTEVEIQFHLNQYISKQQVFEAIDNIPYIYGSTNSADGLATMHNVMFTAANGDRPDVDNIAFMITDGVSNINARRTIPEAEEARADNIHIYAIGIGLTDTRELDAMASTPFSENSFNVQEFDELEGLADRIFGQESTKCAIEPTTPAPCGLAKTDVVLVLDASTSVTEKNFQKMRQFVKDFLSTADIDSGSDRAGVAIYSTEVQIIFHLDAYTRSSDVMTAIDNIPYIYGSTNTADSIKVMRDDMFTYTRGDRPDAPNVGIIITDGVSNINARRTIPEAESTRDQGIHIYAIGIGLSDTRELDAMASVPAADNSFNVQSFDELKGLEKVIFSAVCPKDPVDGVWAPWDDWSECPASCGTSTQIRVRTCTAPPPSNGGLFCEGEDMEYRECDAGPCPVDGSWSRWQPWSTCSEPCGGGSQSTGRACTDPEPRHGGADCTGRASKSRSCNNQPCGLDGNWAAWGLYGQCSVTCGGGDQARYRTCTDPEPQRGGAPCDGQAEQTQTCNDFHCPIDGMWSTWTDWRQCSRSCGGGSQDRKRYCVNPAPQDGGRDCRGQAGQSRSCNDEPCPTPRTNGYDVIFVLDSSVTPEHFRWMLDYTRSAVREMAIDNGMFRVGLLIYSGGAYKQFDLNDFETRADVNAALDKVGYRPGTKNTAAALKFVRKRMFRGMNGDRDFAQNFVVVLTGAGDSTDRFSAATEACQLQAEGVGMFSVGLGPISDLSELDAYSSLPTHDYEILVRNEDSMGEVPGLMLYNLKRSTPDASACPTLPPTTPRPPRPKGKCSSTGDVVFILDSSGSVGQANFYRLLNFTYETVDGLDVDSGNFRVGVVTFSDSSHTAFHLGDFTKLADLKTALVQVGYVYGNTNTAHALRRARMEMFTASNGDRPDIANVVVIITDGQSNVNHELTITEARSLKAAGVTVITVAVGFTSETSELVGITSPPIRENLIYVEDYESLGKLKEQLIDPLCTDSDLCRSRPCQNGAVCLDGIRSFSCVCPTDYFGDTCNKRCGEPADVVIILDSSTTVGEYNFGRLKEYAEHLVREMNSDACSINIGFLKYSSAAMVQVNLGMHTDTETNIRALEQISYTRGRANMAAAFRTLRTEMFNGRGGDRAEARNIAYLLTDGTNDVHAELTEPEAELTISAGVRVIPIGINLREKYELENIAGAQGLQLIEINDEPALIENTDVILNSLFGNNDFCIENPCLNGGACVNEPFGFVCECKVGFTGDTCQKRCSAKGDVVFAVDTSRYVTRRELKKVRRFLRSIVKRMRFKGAFSVGVVEFSDWSKVRLDFTSGASKKAVKASIAGLRVHGGDPEPAQALAKANYRIFNRRGDSGEKPNYLILVTKSMRNEIDILNEANKLKVQGTRIIGVGMGLTTAERDFMQSTVSMPYSDTAMFADDADDLKALSDRIVDYMCDDDDMCAENPCRNGGKCKQLGGDFYCECNSGYAGRYCENRCNARADIVFLLDSSGSVGHVDFRRVKQFVHGLVDEFTVGRDHTRVGLATYSSKSRHGFFLKEYYNQFELQNAIAGIRYEYGNTNTAAGLRLVRDHYLGGHHGDRADIQNFLIVITDGLSNVVPDQTLVEAGLLKASGVHVYAIGVGAFDPFEINHIASAPVTENAYLLKDYSSLANITSSIVMKTCRDPTVCDENPCTNGGVCIPGINGPVCECLPGFRGEHCDQPCTKHKDIIFLLDSSDSVGADNFKASLTFINSMVEEFSFKDTDNRFSLMTFSDKVQIVFSLGRYRDLRIIQNAIKYTRYRPGNTNIADALRTAVEISVSRLGDRGNAENIVFLLTDGESNINEEDTIPAADDLKAAGARVITIGVNMDRTVEIEQIASSEGDVYKVATYNDLGDVREDLLAKACSNIEDLENTNVVG